MAKIINFPPAVGGSKADGASTNSGDASQVHQGQPDPAVREAPGPRGAEIFFASLAIVRGVLVFGWPVLKWAFVFDVFLQLSRTLYYWSTPGAHPGWTLVLDLLIFAWLAYVVDSDADNSEKM